MATRPACVDGRPSRVIRLRVCEYDQSYERNQMGRAKRMSKWAFTEKPQLKGESQGLEESDWPFAPRRHGVRKVEQHVCLEGSMAPGKRRMERPLMMHECSPKIAPQTRRLVAFFVWVL